MYTHDKEWWYCHPAAAHTAVFKIETLHYVFLPSDLSI